MVSSSENDKESGTNLNDENGINISNFLNQDIQLNDDNFNEMCDFISNNISILIPKIEENDIILTTIKALITYQNRTILQYNSVLDLIDRIDQFSIIDFLPSYNLKCIIYLVKLSLNSNDVLSNKACKVSSNFVSMNNIEFFLEQIYKNSDFFDLGFLHKTILLLLQLISKIPFEFFVHILNIITESLRLLNNSIISPDYFLLMSYLPNEYLPSNLFEKEHMAMMKTLYYHLTEMNLFSLSVLMGNERNNFFSSMKPYILGEISESMFSNICNAEDRLDFSDINYGIDNIDDLFVNLKKCFMLYLKYPNPTFIIIYRMLPLFPKETLLFLIQTSRTSNQVQDLVPLVLYTFTVVNDSIINGPSKAIDDQIYLLSLSMKFLLEYNPESLNQYSEYFVKYIHEKRIKNSFEGIIFIQAIDKCTSQNKNLFLMRLFNELDEPQRNLFLLEIVQNFKQEYESLLIGQFPFIGIFNTPEACFKWLQTTPYIFWPIENYEFRMKVKKLLLSKSFTCKIENIQMSQDHWDFLLENPDFFDISYFNQNKNIVKNHIIFQETSHPFQLSKITDVTKLPSLYPFLKRNIILRYKPLICSFLNFSQIKVDENLLQKLTADFNDESITNAIKIYKKHNKILCQSINIKFSTSSQNFKSIIRFLQENLISQQTADEIYLMFFENIQNISKRKHFFYFIRIIRLLKHINSDIQKRNQRKYLKKVIEIFAKGSLNSDFLSWEIYQLLLDLGRIEDIDFFVQYYPFIMPFLKPKISTHIQHFLSYKIPSFYLISYRINSKIMDDNQSNKSILTKHISFEFFFEKILDAYFSSFVIQNNIKILQPVKLFAKLLSYRSAMAVECFDLLMSLISYKNIRLADYDEGIKEIISNGYCLPNLMELIKLYYKNRMDIPTYKSWIDLLLISERLFMATQKIENVDSFVDSLDKSLMVFDSINMVISKIRNNDTRFYISFLVLFKFFNLQDPENKSKLLKSLKSTLNSLNLGSRKEAISLFISSVGELEQSADHEQVVNEIPNEQSINENNQDENYHTSDNNQLENKVISSSEQNDIKSINFQQEIKETEQEVINSRETVEKNIGKENLSTYNLDISLLFAMMETNDLEEVNNLLNNAKKIID